VTLSPTKSLNLRSGEYWTGTIFPRMRWPIWPIPTGMNALSILAARWPFSSGINPKLIQSSARAAGVAKRSSSRLRDLSAQDDLREATMYRTIGSIVTVVALCISTFVPNNLSARDDGRYANSPLKQWFDRLASGKGLLSRAASGTMGCRTG
jgi:hypothetical protein